MTNEDQDQTQTAATIELEEKVKKGGEYFGHDFKVEEIEIQRDENGYLGKVGVHPEAIWWIMIELGATRVEDVTELVITTWARWVLVQELMVDITDKRGSSCSCDLSNNLIANTLTDRLNVIKFG